MSSGSFGRARNNVINHEPVNYSDYEAMSPAERERIQSLKGIYGSTLFKSEPKPDDNHVPLTAKDYLSRFLTLLSFIGLGLFMYLFLKLEDYIGSFFDTQPFTRYMTAGRTVFIFVIFVIFIASPILILKISADIRRHTLKRTKRINICLRFLRIAFYLSGILIAIFICWAIYTNAIYPYKHYYGSP
jgi:hypothetical protein